MAIRLKIEPPRYRYRLAIVVNAANLVAVVIIGSKVAFAVVVVVTDAVDTVDVMDAVNAVDVAVGYKYIG